MNRVIAIWAAVAALATLAAPSPAGAGEHTRRGASITTSADGPIESCAQLRIRFDEREPARAEEELTLSRSATPLKQLRLPSNSGIWVRGADRADYAVRVCKAAASPETLGRISASSSGGALSVAGPEGEDWVVYLLVEAPRDAEVDLEARSGPVSLSGLSGRIRARTANGPLSLRETSGAVEVEAENGPISFRDCAGEVRASARNGPISISGKRGKFDVETQNGPISVALRGLEWEQGGLEARAVNGPVTLTIPDGYRSGTVVETSGRSPVQCRARGCVSARKSWEEDDLRRLEFGETTPVIRLSTVNGPVSVRSSVSED